MFFLLCELIVTNQAEQHDRYADAGDAQPVDPGLYLLFKFAMFAQIDGT